MFRKLCEFASPMRICSLPGTNLCIPSHVRLRSRSPLSPTPQCGNPIWRRTFMAQAILPPPPGQVSNVTSTCGSVWGPHLLPLVSSWVFFSAGTVLCVPSSWRPALDSWPCRLPSRALLGCPGVAPSLHPWASFQRRPQWVPQLSGRVWGRECLNSTESLDQVSACPASVWASFHRSMS